MKNPYSTPPSTESNRRPGRGSRVVVAMSGGVDSSVAAVLLKEQGYDVIGIALQTTDYSKYLGNDSGGSCCSAKDMEDARRVAESIDIPFYVLNTEEAFDLNVVDYFVNDYLQGRTPNPCVMCNTKVKFNYLYKKAMDLGCDFVATGHFAKISKEPKLGYCLWMGRDRNKDQSYFLFNLNQAQLARTLFPVGHLSKDEVRAMAEKYKLPTAQKKESQEICFVGNSNYKKFVEERSAQSRRKPGYIVTEDKVVLSEHSGIHHFTIGQRKGLGDAIDYAKAFEIPNADNFYVTRIDPSNGMVVVGNESKLFAWGLVAERVNWIVSPDLTYPRRVTAKIRYRSEPVEAEVQLLVDHQVKLSFCESQRAVTPGQAVAFFDGDLCLGGGWIVEAIQVPQSQRPQKKKEAGLTYLDP